MVLKIEKTLERKWNRTKMSLLEGASELEIDWGMELNRSVLA